MQTVRVPLDEDNDLFFDLVIESTESVKPPTARLVCETKNFDYSFKGVVEDGEIKVHMPCMEGMLPGGKYDARLEVFVGNKVFTPLEFQVDFKKSVSVVAEIKSAKSEDKEMVTATIKSSKPVVSEAIESDNKNALKRKALADKTRQKRMAEVEAKKKKLAESKRRRLAEAKKERLIEAKKKQLAEAKKKKLAEAAARKKAARKKVSQDEELRFLLEQALTHED